jgi:hypothetical protein
MHIIQLSKFSLQNTYQNVTMTSIGDFVLRNVPGCYHSVSRYSP